VDCGFGLISEIEVNWGGIDSRREGREGKGKGREGGDYCCLFVCLFGHSRFLGLVFGLGGREGDWQIGSCEVGKL
jgi:hypothetical protein